MLMASQSQFLDEKRPLRDQSSQAEPTPPISSSNSGGHDTTRSGTPPPYSGPSHEASSPVTEHSHSQQRNAASKSFPRYPGLPKIDYRIYSPPLFKLSSDYTTLTSKAEYLSANASALVTLLRTQATVPPKPQIQVKGTRGRKVDFDIKLNLMSLLVPDDERMRMDYTRCVGNEELAYRGGVRPDTLPAVGEGGMEEWARRFVEDKSSVKTFILERVVANLDVDWIEGQLRSLVAATKYKGNVDVKFTVTHNKVQVQNPDKVNQFFTSVTSLFAGKNRYEVVKVVWPFASTKNGEANRQCVVQSEDVWWREWRDPIRYAISQKRQGWVTVEDKLEAVMEGKGNNADLIDWGPEYST